MPELTNEHGPLSRLERAPEKLRVMARWYDEVYPHLRHSDGRPVRNSGDEVQTDLRQWAKDIEAILRGWA